jgi:uncharacterized phiE125 gp8 family phage protein
MLPIYKIATAPAAEPVTLSDAKAHLRIESTYTTEDTALSAIISVARDWVEKITGYALITQTWDMYLQEWPDGDSITIGKGPLQSVTHIKYTNSLTVQSTWSSTEYSVDTDSVPGRVVLNYDYSWPDFVAHPKNPIAIRFVAGYGASGACVPPSILHAIKLLIGHFYENREHIVIGSNLSINELPMGVMSLLANYREYVF